MLNIAHEWTAECFVAVRGRGAPTAEEWEAYLSSIARGLQDGRPPRCLVLTQGTSPSPAERMGLAEQIAPVEASLKVAVITLSTYARGVVDALSTTHPGYRTFAPADLDQALEYLGVRVSALAEVKATLARLAGTLDDGAG
jgi:hypothetical protein